MSLQEKDENREFWLIHDRNDNPLRDDNENWEGFMNKLFIDVDKL
jgi:hypothetical protein